MYGVETAHGHRRYALRYSPFEKLSTATLWYNGINVHSGWKKRLVNLETGEVIARVIT